MKEEEEVSGCAVNIHLLSVITPSLFTSDPVCSVDVKLMNSDCLIVSEIPIGISMKEGNEYVTLSLKSNWRVSIQLSPEMNSNELLIDELRRIGRVHFSSLFNSGLSVNPDRMSGSVICVF